MTIRKLSNNAMELLGFNGVKLLISYETCVAIAHHEGIIQITRKFHSKTTSKHINVWRPFGDIKYRHSGVSQAYCDRYYALI